MIRVKVAMYPTITLLVYLIGFSQTALTLALPSNSEFEHLPKPESWRSDDIDDDDDSMAFIQKLIAGIVSFVVVVVAVCLILCFCCPICIIAKMRQRRGVVIRTGPGATTTTNGRTVTVTVNRSAAPAPLMASPPVVAIPNNYNGQNKPYPVQESVTVVPLIQPQQQPQYPPHPQQQMSYAGQQQYPQNFELPPPYPGLPREADNSNLPYNPYFTGEGDAPSAPPK